jgi:hypothetical protein
MKTITIPEDFHIESHGGNCTMGWTDETYKYHVWLKADGTLSQGRERNVIHANLKVVSPKAKNFGHSTRDPNSKMWKPLIDAMLAKIKDEDLIQKAVAAKKAAEQAFEAERTRKYHARLRKTFEDVLHVLPGNVQAAVACMGEEQITTFLAAYEQARFDNECAVRAEAYRQSVEVQS